MSLKRKRSVLSMKDESEDTDDIVFKMICKRVVSRLKFNVVFLIESVLLGFALHKYSYFRLSGLFNVVPQSPDNRGST